MSWKRLLLPRETIKAMSADELRATMESVGIAYERPWFLEDDPADPAMVVIVQRREAHEQDADPVRQEPTPA